MASIIAAAAKTVVGEVEEVAAEVLVAFKVLSSSRMQPVFSVSSFGQVTRVNFAGGYDASSNQSNRNSQPALRDAGRLAQSSLDCTPEFVSPNTD